MQNNTVETLIAAAVIAVAVGFLFFAYSSTHSGNFNTYEVQASLGSVDGIISGADVRVHGIKIGTVSSYRSGSEDIQTCRASRAARRRSISRTIRPSGSHRGILNGNPYLSIQPGRSGKMLVAGEAWKA